jgi:nucleoside-diphosphate-sugar epimerase
MKILITGGSGFIGSHLLDYYITKGDCTLLSIDIKNPSKHEHIKYFKCCDVLKYDCLKNIFIEFSPDYVVHLAAKADIKGNDLEYYSVNIEGVKNIVKASAEIRTIKKVMFASTMLVCSVGYIPKTDVDFSPPNFYGQIGEKLVRSESANCFSWTIVRPSAIWGPGFGKVSRSFFEYIAKGMYFNFSGKMGIKTNGYIENIIYQIDQLLLSHKSDFNVYYLGDYDAYSIKDWANEVGLLMNRRVRTIPSSFIRLLAHVGDFLRIFGFSFPLTSFRYKNMTTDNILPLDNLKEIVPNLPFNRQDGNRKTIAWMKEQKFI